MVDEEKLSIKSLYQIFLLKGFKKKNKKNRLFSLCLCAHIKCIRMVTNVLLQSGELSQERLLSSYYFPRGLMPSFVWLLAGLNVLPRLQTGNDSHFIHEQRPGMMSSLRENFFPWQEKQGNYLTCFIKASVSVETCHFFACA